LAMPKLIWIGATGGSMWKQRPLRLAFEYRCFFRKMVQGALNRENIPWEMAIESEQSRPIEAGVSADLAIHTMIEGTAPPHAEIIQHGGTLPELSSININLYVAESSKGQAAADLASLVRQAFRRSAMQAVA